MDLITIFLAGFALILVLILWYTVYMSYNHGVFKKMGVVGPAPSPIFGNFLSEVRCGVFQYHLDLYSKYKDYKVYGMYRARYPVLVIRDLDMYRDIYVKKFHAFVNRPNIFEGSPPLDRVVSIIKDDEWKRLRSIMSPAFSTGKLRRMYTHIKRSTKTFLENLKDKQERNEPVELKEIICYFTMDVIASAGFGYEVNSLKDKTNVFIRAGNGVLNSLGKILFIFYFLNFMHPVLNALGLRAIPKWIEDFFNSFVDKAKEERLSEMKHGSQVKRNDFLQLMMEAEDDNPQDNDNMTKEEAEAIGAYELKRGKLSTTDIKSNLFVLFLAGYDTVATSIAFALFILAMHPECCQKVQEEIDEELQGEFPTYDSVQKMPYLDMCINETMRLYPAAFVLDRVCNEDVDVQGYHIPKGMTVLIPVCAIHRDPEIWPEPDTFDPERFSPENKAKRHPYAHQPFGHGPRNCIAMRLALIELKLALAAVLQVMTPVPCDKSVYPIQLEPLMLKAKDGLWVKFEQRKPRT